MAWVSLCLWALCAETVQLQAATEGDPPDALSLWYAQPATTWTDTLPIGNGRLGAMVYGGIEQEHLQLNEDTLWSGGPHCYDNPDAYQHLATVRDLLERGAYADAEAAAQKMLGRPKYQQAYMPFGDLFLAFPQAAKPSEYRRELNLQNAVSTVTYRIGHARFTRTVFASHPDQVIVMRLECDRPGQITFDLSVASPHAFKSQAISNDTLSMAGHLEPRDEVRLIGPWKEDGLRFAARVNVVADGGTVVAQGDKISVHSADAVTLVYVAATSYVDYQNVSGDPVAKVDAYLAGVRGKSFERLYQRHVEDHSMLFGRVAINLGSKGDSENLSTDQRLKRAVAGSADPLLAEQLFQYGRYLMIDALETSGQLENTAIVFFSDHSIFLGNHGVKYKGNLFEESLNTSMIVCYPKRFPQAQDKVDPHPMELLDLVPTTFELAGIDNPNDVAKNGLSIVPLLEGKETNGRTYAFSEIQGAQSATDERYRYITCDGIDILYDHESDIWERLCLVGQTRNASKSQRRHCTTREAGSTNVQTSGSAIMAA